MNKAEKKAFEILGEEAKEKIAGGARGDEALTDKQCSELRKAVSELSEDEQLEIAGGQNTQTRPDAHPGWMVPPEHMVELCYGMPKPKIEFRPKPLPKEDYESPSKNQ